MSVAEQLAVEDRIVLAAIAVALAAALTIYFLVGTRKHRPGTTPKQRRGDRWSVGSSTYLPGRVPGLTSSQILDVVSRIGGPLPPAGHVDDTDYVLRAQTHQQCYGSPCLIHNLYSEHCRCGNDWVCEEAGPLNQSDRPIPRQRDGQPYNRQDDPGRGRS